MKTLLLLFILTSDPHPTADTTVYICDSSTAKRYHLDKGCKGLRTCQHQVRKMKLTDATKKGRTLCGWEKPRS